MISMDNLKKFFVIFSLIIIFINILFSSEITISDYYYKTIEAGERLYINGLYGVESYSIDFNRKLFSDGGVLKFEGDRLLVGSLRQDLIPGTVDTIIFSTKEGMEYLELKISPSDFDLRIDSVRSSVKGRVLFFYNNNFIKNGIDSLFLLYESNENFVSQKIFSILEDSSNDNNSFPFEIKKPVDEKDYSISLVKFTGSLSDTFYYLEGFTTKAKIENFVYPFLMDSRSKMVTDNITGLYSDFNFDFISTFYNYEIPSESIIQYDSKYFVYLNVDGGKLLKETKFLSELKEISKKVPTFIFTRNIIQFLNLPENRSSKDFLEMMFGIEFREYDEIEQKEFLLDPLDDEDVEFFWDKNEKDYSAYYLSDTISFFMYLPKSLNIDILDQLLKNSKNIKKQEIFGKLSSIIEFENIDKNEIKISYYDNRGNFIGEVFHDINYLNRVLVDISKTFKQNFDRGNGFYIYKVYSGGVEKRKGIFLVF
ncbi:MAG: hypothetical protein ABIN00_00040 [candidate division WOR-3 bacterium]